MARRLSSRSTTRAPNRSAPIAVSAAASTASRSAKRIPYDRPPAPFAGTGTGVVERPPAAVAEVYIPFASVSPSAEDPVNPRHVRLLAALGALLLPATAHADRHFMECLAGVTPEKQSYVLLRASCGITLDSGGFLLTKINELIAARAPGADTGRTP